MIYYSLMKRIKYSISIIKMPLSWEHTYREKNVTDNPFKSIKGLIEGRSDSYRLF